VDFELTDEQRMVQETARSFAVDRLRPVAAANDKAGRFDVARYRELAELGLMGVNVRAEYGGSEMGVVAYSLAITEIARECAATAVTTAVNNMVAETIQAYGTEEQKRRFVPAITGGAFPSASFCLSEAGAGSDAGALRTAAVRQGDVYVLDGEKMWITSGAYSGVHVVWARTGGPGAAGISAFLVTPDLPGFRVGREEEKLGIRASNTVSIVLEECQVPAANLLAREGDGFRIAMSALDGGRIGVASQAIGIAWAARDAAARYANERRQFGQRIGEFAGVRDLVADMSTELDAARLLALRAAAAKERCQAGRGPRFTREAAMAKLYAAEMANRVCGHAVQIHGGYGYTTEFPVERHFRDARVTTIYEGTSQVQRIVIAREVLRQVAGEF
jgi:hypothetical protein